MSAKLRMLTPDDKLIEIRRLYFQTTKHTIQQDLARALDLLKSMNSEEERERAAVYMDGLSQMRSEWARGTKRTGSQKVEVRSRKEEGRRRSKK